MDSKIEQEITAFKPKLKTLSGQEHLDIQAANDYRKLAWYAYYIETLEDYRQKLIDSGKYEAKHADGIDSEIAGIQANYDALYTLLSSATL